MLPTCGAESKHGRSAAPAPAAPSLPAAPASARPTPRSALSSGERLRPRPRGGWITAAPRGPRVLGDSTWIYIRAGAASARVRPFYLAPDTTAKGRRAKPFIFQPKNKCAEINTPLQLGGPGSGGRRREGEQSRSRAAAGTPGPRTPGPTWPPHLARVAPGTAGCRAVPTHPYPGSGTRLFASFVRFCLPAASCSLRPRGGVGRGGTGTRATAPRRRISATPREWAAGRAAEPAGRTGLSSRPLPVKTTGLLTERAAPGAAGPGPAPPPRLSPNAGSPSAASASPGAGAQARPPQPPGRAMVPGAGVPSDLPSPDGAYPATALRHRGRRPAGR